MRDELDMIYNMIVSDYIWPILSSRPKVACAGKIHRCLTTTNESICKVLAYFILQIYLLIVQITNPIQRKPRSYIDLQIHNPLQHLFQFLVQDMLPP